MRSEGNRVGYLSHSLAWTDDNDSKHAALVASVTKLESELESKERELQKQKDLALGIEKEAAVWRQRAEKLKERLRTLT